MTNKTLTCKEALKTPQIQSHLNVSNKWWSNYIFHFSHVENIALILNSNMLYSREQLEKLGLTTLNDNASQDVINGTEKKLKDYVRFYFRPLTPTQYHNEGIRAKGEYTELNAHCPVPVFLLFDSSLLDRPDAQFSYESLASHYTVPLYNDVSSLLQAPFEHIYHNQSTYGLDANTIIKRRHAEVVIKKKCDLSLLKRIICRNKTEAKTLKLLMNEQALNLYEEKICVIGTDTFDTMSPHTIFRNEYLQIQNITLSTEKCRITFNKPCKHPRKLYVSFLNKKMTEFCYYKTEDFTVTDSCEFILTDLDKFINDKKEIYIKIQMDNTLVCFNRFTKN